MKENPREKDLIKRQEIYDLYWYFAYERQEIFLKKKRGLPAPWTKDEILKKYKFCNTYRVNDRVSQYLIKNVIDNGNKYTARDTIFRILLFKLFNKESTWELLEKELGEITIKNFNFSKMSKILTNALENGQAIYNDAYISCANKAFGFDRKHDNHLALLKKMFFEDQLDIQLLKCKTMKEGFLLLKAYPLIGNFLAYQLITDINYSEVVNFSENEFTVVGPGSHRGINKCFISRGNFTYEEIIHYMYKNQQKEFKRLGYDFHNIGNRPLQLIDCQGLFCEIDKYCREASPTLKSNRKRIKKKYKPKTEKIEYKYPPKWKI